MLPKLLDSSDRSRVEVLGLLRILRKDVASKALLSLSKTAFMTKLKLWLVFTGMPREGKLLLFLLEILSVVGL